MTELTNGEGKMAAFYEWLLTLALALVAMAGVGAVVLFIFSLDRVVP
jgi:hypothetical protein